MFDDFDFGDAHESEPNDYNPYESEANDYNPYESEANDYNPYESNADSDNSYLYDANSEESQDGFLGCNPLSSFDAVSSEAFDSTVPEETSPHSSSNPKAEKNHAAKIPFGGSGPGSRCKLCACPEFLWPIYGRICKNCGHHYDHHW